MSIAFRIFILMLFGFGAIWIYRFRSSDLREWLYPRSPLITQKPRDPLTSPVDRVLGPDLDLGWIRLQERVLPSPDGFGEEPPLQDPFPDSGDAAPVGDLPSEEQLAAADLPLEEDAGDPGAGADGEGGEAALGTSGASPSSRSFDGGPGEGASGTGQEESGKAIPQRQSQPLAFEEILYKVQEGESLWQIAQKLLGSGARYRDICAWNRELLGGKDDAILTVGTELRIRRPVTRETLKNPPGQTDTSVAVRSGPGASAPERGFALHTVKRNENLKKIARRYYPGDLEGWKTIFEANRQALSSADLVAEGTVLKIPLSRFGSPADRR